MGHQRVDGADGRVRHVVLVNEAVAVGNPVFAVDAVVANRAVVAFLTPRSVGVVVPEGACPCADGGVEEDVAAAFFAHEAFEADNAFCVLIARVAWVGANGRELCGDTVELEEAEVAVVLREVLGGSLKRSVVFGVGEFHLLTLIGPVLAAVVAAGAVATHRAEPCAYACAHLGCLSGHVAHFVGEA